jgi:hypothetical protein
MHKDIGSMFKSFGRGCSFHRWKHQRRKPLVVPVTSWQTQQNGKVAVTHSA